MMGRFEILFMAEENREAASGKEGSSLALQSGRVEREAAGGGPSDKMPI
jgi:hypothetical protein